MKTSHLIGCAVALLVLILGLLLWRQGDMADEIATLRARLEALAPKPAAVAVVERDAALPPEPVAEAPASGENPGEQARIADLERVAHGQADAIEALWDKLNGMELSQRRAAAPAWSALQAVGAPDSSAGDQRTAWAPATEDGGQEWLQADFPNMVEVASVIVRENCAPGAIIRISAVTDAGNELPLWQGDAPKVSAVSNTPFPAAGNILANRIKIYLDTKKVPGWNEIDAVQLVGRDGSRQWATGASASSTYGAGSGLQLGTAPRMNQWSADGAVLVDLNATVPNAEFGAYYDAATQTQSGPTVLKLTTMGDNTTAVWVDTTPVPKQ